MLFWIYLGFLALYVLAELGAAYLDGWAFEWQVPPSYPKHLTFWGHAGMHGDFWIINPIVAYLLAMHASSWALPEFALIFAIVAFVGAYLLVPLLEDSERVPSALARGGLLPLAGAMHYPYFIVGMSVCLSYYLLTKRTSVDKLEIVVITGMLALHWALGVLQPPKKVHGKVHTPAKVTAIGGWVCMVALGLWLYGS